MERLVILAPFVALLRVLCVSAEKSWVSLEVNVPVNLTDDSFSYPEVPIYLGTPQQRLNLTINLSGDLLSAFSDDCVFCAGTDTYSSEESTTAKGPLRPWAGSTKVMFGNYYQDTVNLGGVISANDVELVSISDVRPRNVTFNNGVLPAYVNAAAKDGTSLLETLWRGDKLLNPVIGLRLDAKRPRFTIGALDPNDYQGEINWVQMEEPASNGDYTNAFKLDGVKGYNGSFLPGMGGDNLVASINTLYKYIAIPEQSNLFALNDDYLGPNQAVNLPPPSGLGGGGFELKCDWNAGQIPPVYFTTTINGIDYPMSDMLMNTSGSSAHEYCNVNIRNTTQNEKPDIVLGSPFLRSVYVAYRFPTDNCPGFYGFAFLKGLPYTQSQVDQKPRATPTLHSQCLANLISPTSTPTPTAIASTSGSGGTAKTGSYWVYNRYDDGQVPLLGIDELPRGIWNSSWLGK